MTQKKSAPIKKSATKAIATKKVAAKNVIPAKEPVTPTPEIHSEVSVTTSEGTFNAKVSGVHHGSRIDAVVYHHKKPHSVSAIHHKKNSSEVPFWEEKK